MKRYYIIIINKNNLLNVCDSVQFRQYLIRKCSILIVCDRVTLHVGRCFCKKRNLRTERPDITQREFQHAFTYRHTLTTIRVRQIITALRLDNLVEKVAVSPALIDDGRSAYTKDHNLLSISGYIDVCNWFLYRTGSFDLDGMWFVFAPRRNIFVSFLLKSSFILIYNFAAFFPRSRTFIQPQS